MASPVARSEPMRCRNAETGAVNASRRLRANSQNQFRLRWMPLVIAGCETMASAAAPHLAGGRRRGNGQVFQAQRHVSGYQ
jgi:hypothetical protein